MRIFASLLCSALLLTACQDSDRADDALAREPEMNAPGSSDSSVYAENLVDETVNSAGDIESYENEEADGEYSNVFRRSEEDRDFDSPIEDPTPDDENFPYEKNEQPRAAINPDPSGSYEVEDRAGNSTEYGSAATPGTSDSSGTAVPLREKRGGNQANIGAVGYDEEGGTGGSDAGQGSFFRPLEAGEDGYSEDVIQLGARTSMEDDIDSRYTDLTKRMYAVEKNQNVLAFQPNLYDYSVYTTWSATGLAVDSSSGEVRTVEELQAQQPPTYGSGCDKDEDPIGCSTENLDADLKGLFNNPRVVAAMEAEKVSGIRFRIDETGKILPGSVEVTETVQGGTCNSGPCRQLAGSVQRSLAKTTWQPATRGGSGISSIVTLPLNYTPPEDVGTNAM